MDFSQELEVKKANRSAARSFGERLAMKSYSEPPIPVRVFIEQRYNIEIVDRELNQEISAIVKFNKNRISLNTTKHPNHQRFTLAHELGHLELKHDIRQFTEYSDHVGKSSSKPWEVEANAFAAGFLMPVPLLKKYIRKEKDPNKLAQLFKVSPDAMWISISSQGLMKYL